MGQKKSFLSAIIWILPFIFLSSFLVSQLLSPLTIPTAATNDSTQNQPQQPDNVDPDEDTALTNGVIPSDAVRLRIIANSDSPQDQQLKRDIRDQIIAIVGKKLNNVTDKAQAEAILKSSVPELDQVSQRVIHQEGFTYPTQTEVGVVPFPTKLYGDQVYPAGNYEALRIIIGNGQGQNWWCVLFPPLCFVDLANGDAVPNKKDFPDKEATVAKQVQVPAKSSDTKHTKATKAEESVNNTLQTSAGNIQVRFAVVDYGKKFVDGFVHAISGLFHNLFG